MPDLATPAAKLRMALELSAFAEKVLHQNLRRRYPDESEEQIYERLRRWLLKLDEPIDLPPGFRVRTKGFPSS